MTTFSDNFAYYVNQYSNANTPVKITVNETKSNKVLRVLQDNARLVDKLAGYSYAKKEFIKVRTASDYELNAWIVKPVDFDESKKYPVLMFQYSGPNSQQVLDKYGFDWEQYLAANGIITVCVDGRWYEVARWKNVLTVSVLIWRSGGTGIQGPGGSGTGFR